MKSLVHNFTHLKVLDLGDVEMNFTVPEPLTNKTSLTYLGLEGCSLQEIFPTGIFHLPNLKSLNLAYNMDLRGKLPEFHSSSPLQVIDLSATSFYGELPLSIGNLHSLEEFFILDCNFRGYIPSSFENLTQLKVLELSYNNFSVQTLSSLPFFGKLTQLIYLKLDGMN
ncbi:hypothetical protein Pint_28964 [Pistacia integerrima]|uniref:Uncharacterized protein n=1 Tax=Pistacia integerrima TaxID=434235 RepID=A0ACC0X1V8_9ROSI|nr:hypothetical protein Pint_28964 [Pistacia integerrima]